MTHLSSVASNLPRDVLKSTALARLGILLLVLAWTLSSGMVIAQDTTAGTDVTANASDYPAGLDDPSIAIEELQYRLTPLTLASLRPLAAAWQEHARAATQAGVDKSLELRAAEEKDKDPLRAERLTLLRERGYVFNKYLAVVSSLEAKGGDPAEVAEYRAYVSAITSRESSWMTPQEFADSVLKWLASPEGGMQIVFRIVVIAGS